MKHAITVLQDDIDNGTPSDGRKCAMALAARRELFRDDIIVSSRYLHAGTEFHAELPAEARRFIPVFDHYTAQAEPFKFEIYTTDGPAPSNSGLSFFANAVNLTWHDEIPIFAGGGEITETLAAKYLEDKSFGAPWTPEFGSAPISYTPAGWEPDSLTVTTTN